LLEGTQRIAEILGGSGTGLMVYDILFGIGQLLQVADKRTSAANNSLNFWCVTVIWSLQGSQVTDQLAQAGNIAHQRLNLAYLGRSTFRTTSTCGERSIESGLV
jgi:hypothetical protein